MVQVFLYPPNEMTSKSCNGACHPSQPPLFDKNSSEFLLFTLSAKCCFIRSLIMAMKLTPVPEAEEWAHF